MIKKTILELPYDKNLIKFNENGELNYNSLITEKFEKSDLFLRFEKEMDKLLIHPGSRAKAVLSLHSEVKDKFVEWRKRGWERVNPETLIPNREEKYWGANYSKFDDNGQPFIICEAPFYAEDYYELALKTGMRILVSTARPEHDNISYRQGYSVNKHYIGLNSRPIKINDKITISCVAYEKHPVGDNHEILIKHLKVTENNRSYTLCHLIYENWEDAEAYKKLKEENKYEDILGIFKLIKLADKSINELFEYELYRLKNNLIDKLSIDNANSYGIMSNCKYGFGRSAAFLICFKIYAQIKNEISKEKNLPLNKIKDIFDYPDVIENLELNAISYVAYFSEKVMTGAGEVHLPQINGFFEYIKEEAKKKAVLKKSDSIRRNYESVRDKDKSAFLYK
ncbi:MAG: hypothetical protein J0H68_08495 [Sphingobacteriia bacterium]|nr:hypothetical protein [Sphingobacteriia bacterium]